MGMGGDRVLNQGININFRDRGLRFIKNMRKLSKLLSGRVAIEFQTEQKFQLQRIHLRARNASHTSVILVVEVHIIGIFGSHQHRGNEQTVDGSGVDKHRPLVFGDTVQVYESNNKGLDGAGGVGDYSFNILTNRDGGDARGMEPGERRVGIGSVFGHDGLEGIRKGGDENINSRVGEGLHLHDGQSGGVFEDEQRRRKREKGI